jgi:glycosyltransferase involved in cell wall biosynthesis
VPRVVITMPAYQAEGTLERTVLAIPEGVADELILVDDASRDGTAELARRLGLTVHVHPENRGYGGNQKSCYRLALDSDADIVVLLHPDYQYEPKAVPLLVAPILAGEADVTFGSRFAGMGDPLGGGMPLYRYLGNRVTTIAQNLFLGTRFTDMHSGMRAYTRRALASLPFLGYPDGFSFDAELLVDAVTSGLRVVEVPIPTRYTIESSSISVARSLEYVVHGTGYAARRSIARGRRGRRYLPGWRRARPRRLHGVVEPISCAACGHEGLVLLHPATANGAPTEDDFRCTARGLGQHDDLVGCPRCGLVSARSPLDQAALVAGYAAAVDETYLDEEAARREGFAWIADRVDRFVVGDRRLVEIGAHVGLFLAVARERGWKATGIEPSVWAVARGRDRFGVDLDEGTAETVELEPGSVDVLALLDVLEHLADPVGTLRRLRPALDDRGLLALTVLNLASTHARFRGEGWPWFTRSHLHYFDPPTLIRLLRDAGFDVVSWEDAPRTFHASYLATRGEEAVPGSAALGRAARLADPRLPAGWLGDVALVLARPGLSV